MTKSEGFLVLVLAGVLAYFVFIKPRNNYQIMNTISSNTNPNPPDMARNTNVSGGSPNNTSLIQLPASNFLYNNGNVRAL